MPRYRMPKVSFNEVVDALKNSLRDLERVRMTAPNDAELRDLKREIRKMIERAERGAAPQDKRQSGGNPHLRNLKAARGLREIALTFETQGGIIVAAYRVLFPRPSCAFIHPSRRKLPSAHSELLRGGQS